MNDDLPPSVRCRLRVYMVFIVVLVALLVAASLYPLVGGA